ncbi:MAG: zinc ribbon domain-containing protein YjdM [Tepidisphaeraceae bacterium]
MDELPACPKCECAYTYLDGTMCVCPECAHEWNPSAKSTAEAAADGPRVWRDANGTELHDGDSVTVIKDLKVKGAGATVKAGTKVRNIRLVEGDHDIDCRIDGIGAMGLKTQFVRKA